MEVKNTKRFHTGDLVAADIGSYSEIYGIIINDDVFHDSVNNKKTPLLCHWIPNKYLVLE